MDCCNYGEYRGHGVAPYAAGWEGYAPGYAPLPYAPYAPAHAYCPPHAQDPYARYYRYDYPAHHPHHNEHVLPMEYGAYASKEVRARRAISRRERPLLPAQHLPHPPTPPLECGMNGRGPAYCEPQMWPHYQMGALGGGGWGGANVGSWAARSSCSREHMRYPSDCRPMKGPHHPVQNQACLQDGRSTPFRAYEEPYSRENIVRPGVTPEAPAASVAAESARPVRDRFYVEPRRTPPEEKRPPVVPLPAFQQAFGSTEIGKFAEAFTRAEVALEEAADAFAYDAFAEWDAPHEPQWSSQPASREIKCEDNY
ncbi:hypothetical protein ABMA28_015619 [Loxostege sticticalis]|uniref:Uncharacterized protein n=1 Tax=Loxostege sticticalis TaxID=481309 RepID=A0ABD0TD00_LOXSC